MVLLNRQSVPLRDAAEARYINKEEVPIRSLAWQLAVCLWARDYSNLGLFNVYIVGVTVLSLCAVVRGS